MKARIILPAMPSNPELTDIVARLIAPHGEGVQSLADMLNTVQQQLGYVPPSTVPLIAEKARVTRPEVYKAIELSPSLKLIATGQHKVYICNADNCCMQGGVQLMQHAKERLGIQPFQTTVNQKIRLESFHCLGNCSMSPNVMIDGRVYGMMDKQLLDKMLDELETP